MYLLVKSSPVTKVVVAPGQSIDSVEIMNGGSNYSDGNYYLDTRVIGAGTPNTFTVTSAGISSHIGDVVQFTGVGTGTDTYHRITGVTARNSVSIARTTGDPVITTDNYAFVTAPSVAFTASGDVVTATGHGLAVGNKFRVIGINTNNFGDYIVGVSTLTNKFEVTGGIGAASGFILKHGLSSNAGVSDKSDENLDRRAITIFDGETLTLSEPGGINANSTTTSFSVGGAEGYMTSGAYADGALAEVFLKLGKQGSTLAGVMDAFSIAVSIGLQYGVPLETFVEKFSNLRFEPAGMTDDVDIRMAQSMMDYIFRRLALDYLPFDERAALGLYTVAEREAALNNGGEYAPVEGDSPKAVAPVAAPVAAVAKASSTSTTSADIKIEVAPAMTIGSSSDLLESMGIKSDAPLCMTCGVKMRMSGACFVCEGCGNTSGCS